MYQLYRGTVINLQELSTSRVYGTHDYVGSSSSLRKRFFIKSSEGKEHEFSLHNFDIPLREGHHVAVFTRNEGVIKIEIEELGSIYSYDTARKIVQRKRKDGCCILDLILILGTPYALFCLVKLYSSAPIWEEYHITTIWKYLILVVLACTPAFLIKLSINKYFERKITRLERQITHNFQKLRDTEQN